MTSEFESGSALPFGEHEALEAELAALMSSVATRGGDLDGEAWERFHAALVDHLDGEERILIDASARVDARGLRALAHEHRHIRSLALEISTVRSARDRPLRMLRDLSDTLRAHAKTEGRLLAAAGVARERA